MNDTFPSDKVFSLYSNPSLTNVSTIPTLSNTNWNGNILLFFVALGFGILFCNLWVIIGIKYCYRYSNTNHPETMEIERIIPQNQNCQKKLMTQGEADQQFPSILYKVWLSQHKRQKQQFYKTLSNDKQNNQANDSDLESNVNIESNKYNEENAFHQEKTHNFNTSQHNYPMEEALNSQNLYSCTDIPSNVFNRSYSNLNNQHNDISISIPNEQQSKHEDEYVKESEQKKASSSGSPEDASFSDTCAICLDIFQDDDEIRVLTCDHIYHSSCIVPWFTTRRAMCPLCKHDFYIPKIPVNTDMENTSRNMPPFPEVQVYEHRMHHSSLAFFSAYEPQRVEQYRASTNNDYRNSTYGRGANRRSSPYTRLSRILLFRRNNSFI
ncbi:hypothetical protein PNEG_00409 [Pneumocystis murina B123]|uniref:RING-type E3 ubiquitin transferase n=1 Tax=Pneumocystis murina (strain B123) TaxID=1069680 RepID=M7PLQ2_PNEMU|nr:hypothetical protein PNEG_00409 [Pneumocystis murina B123]EMR11384.1 hypothetical protein PNEG_00409 [Pneumocystis murina B123]